MLLIYIAGAYSADTFAAIQENINRADALGREVVGRFGRRNDGVFVSIPHNNTPLNWDGIQSGKWFYKATMELLKRCDAMIYVPGDEECSTGTADEILHCQKNCKPYFCGDRVGLAEFNVWLTGMDVQNND